jgi:hypothetical protein
MKRLNLMATMSFRLYNVRSEKLLVVSSSLTEFTRFH